MDVKKTVVIRTESETVEAVIKALEESEVPKSAEVVKIEPDYELVGGDGFAFKRASSITVEWWVEE